MKRIVFLVIALLSSCNDKAVSDVPKTEVVDPNDISMGDYIHDSLPEALLIRIKATTDVFEPIDGISYEQAVDLYKRDIDPESNLVIWEEMVRAFQTFCLENCQSMEKKKEVYKVLLLTSMFPEDEVFNQLEPRILSPEDVKKINSLYTINPQPISVVKE